MTTIKRIIFDLDNTLIPWKDEYVEGFKKAITECNIPFDITKESEMYDSFERLYDKYTYENMIHHFKNNYGIDINDNFIDTWINYLGEQADYDEDVKSTLEYLQQKYELVLLTNFFKKCQEKRLIIAGLYEYFTEIYGGDKYLKPDPRSFKQAIGLHNPQECVMIGDNLKLDIEGALNVGLNVIFFNRKNIETNFDNIQNIKELKNIL